MFGARIWWRTRGFFESRYRRHVPHLAPWGVHAGRVASMAGPSHPVDEAIGREVWALLDPGSPRDAALMLVGVGAPSPKRRVAPGSADRPSINAE